MTHPWIGSWKLVSFETRTPDGRSLADLVANPLLRRALSIVGSIGAVRLPMNIAPNEAVFHPFGPHPEGVLLYSADGYVSLTMCSAGRRGFGSETVLTARAGLKARALMSYLSCAGTYVVQGNRMIHSVETHLYPDEVGREHEFTLEFPDPDTLILVKPTEPSELFGGASLLSTGTWRRRNPPSGGAR